MTKICIVTELEGPGRGVKKKLRVADVDLLSKEMDLKMVTETVEQGAGI